MMKNVGIFILFSILLFTVNFISAEGAPLYRDFPVYPPESLESPEEKESDMLYDFGGLDNTAINVGYVSAGLKKGRENDDRAAFDALKIEIQKAKDYLDKESHALSWVKFKEEIYSDGGSNLLIFVKKYENHIVIVHASIWHGMEGVGEVPTHWGTITYEFSKYPVFLYKGFPLFPSVTSFSDCRVSYDYYGNEVLTASRGIFSKWIEPYTTLYECPAILPTLYGWQKAEDIIFKKDYHKGTEIFFIKDNAVVKASDDWNNKSVLFVFFTPEQAREIIINRQQKSPGEAGGALKILERIPQPIQTVPK